MNTHAKQPTALLSLRLAAMLVGKKHIAQRLCGSLRLDISKNREMLGWSPPYKVDKALEDTAKDFYRVNRQ